MHISFLGDFFSKKQVKSLMTFFEKKNIQVQFQFNQTLHFLFSLEAGETN